MAVLDTTRAQFNTGFFGRIGQTIASVTNAALDWNDARVTRNSLSSLSDRELEDIGLCRGDIEDVATRG